MDSSGEDEDDVFDLDNFSQEGLSFEDDSLNPFTFDDGDSFDPDELLGTAEPDPRPESPQDSFDTPPSFPVVDELPIGLNASDVEEEEEDVIDTPRMGDELDAEDSGFGFVVLEGGEGEGEDGEDFDIVLVSAPSPPPPPSSDEDSEGEEEGEVPAPSLALSEDDDDDESRVERADSGSDDEAPDDTGESESDHPDSDSDSDSDTDDDFDDGVDSDSDLPRPSYVPYHPKSTFADSLAKRLYRARVSELEARQKARRSFLDKIRSLLCGVAIDDDGDAESSSAVPRGPLSRTEFDSIMDREILGRIGEFFPGVGVVSGSGSGGSDSDSLSCGMRVAPLSSFDPSPSVILNEKELDLNARDEEEEEPKHLWFHVRLPKNCPASDVAFASELCDCVAEGALRVSQGQREEREKRMQKQKPNQKKKKKRGFFADSLAKRVMRCKLRMDKAKRDAEEPERREQILAELRAEAEAEAEAESESGKKKKISSKSDFENFVNVRVLTGIVPKEVENVLCSFLEKSLVRQQQRQEIFEMGPNCLVVRFLKDPPPEKDVVFVKKIAAILTNVFEGIPAEEEEEEGEEEEEVVIPKPRKKRGFFADSLAKRVMRKKLQLDAEKRRRNAGPRRAALLSSLRDRAAQVHSVEAFDDFLNCHVLFAIPKEVEHTVCRVHLVEEDEDEEEPQTQTPTRACFRLADSRQIEVSRFFVEIKQGSFSSEDREFVSAVGKIVLETRASFQSPSAAPAVAEADSSGSSEFADSFAKRILRKKRELMEEDRRSHTPERRRQLIVSLEQKWQASVNDVDSFFEFCNCEVLFALGQEIESLVCSFLDPAEETDVAEVSSGSVLVFQIVDRNEDVVLRFVAEKKRGGSLDDEEKKFLEDAARVLQEARKSFDVVADEVEEDVVELAVVGSEEEETSIPEFDFGAETFETVLPEDDVGLPDFADEAFEDAVGDGPDDDPVLPEAVLDDDFEPDVLPVLDDDFETDADPDIAVPSVLSDDFEPDDDPEDTEGGLPAFDDDFLQEDDSATSTGADGTDAGPGMPSFDDDDFEDDDPAPSESENPKIVVEQPQESAFSRLRSRLSAKPPPPAPTSEEDLEKKRESAFAALRNMRQRRRAASMKSDSKPPPAVLTDDAQAQKQKQDSALAALKNLRARHAKPDDSSPAPAAAATAAPAPAPAPAEKTEAQIIAEGESAIARLKARLNPKKQTSPLARLAALRKRSQGKPGGAPKPPSAGLVEQKLDQKRHQANDMMAMLRARWNKQGGAGGADGAGGAGPSPKPKPKPFTRPPARPPKPKPPVAAPPKPGPAVVTLPKRSRFKRKPLRRDRAPAPQGGLRRRRQRRKRSLPLNPLTVYRNSCERNRVSPNRTLLDLIKTKRFCVDETIDCRMNFVGKRGVFPIADVLKCYPDCRNFLIPHNGFRNDGCAALSEAFGLHPAIERIDFSRNVLSLSAVDSIINMLKCNRRIVEVNLTRTRIDQEDLERIEGYLQRNRRLSNQQ